MSKTHAINPLAQPEDLRADILAAIASELKADPTTAASALSEHADVIVGALSAVHTLIELEHGAETTHERLSNLSGVITRALESARGVQCAAASMVYVLEPAVQQ